jgi:PAS domain S-box-containing protein
VQKLVGWKHVEKGSLMTLTGTHHMDLVALSVIIAILSSYVALDLAQRCTTAERKAKLGWLTGGGMAMGLGIWSMHFTGMLAFTLPIPIYYDVTMVALSVLAAVVASWIALFIVSQKGMSTSSWLVGGLCMASAIGAMHYIGMAAMRVQAEIHYDPAIVGLSLGVAFAASLSGLKLAFWSRLEMQDSVQWRKVGSALLMGGAIPSMHYTAMAAVSFTSSPHGVELSDAILDASVLGGGAMVAVSCLILVFAHVAVVQTRALLSSERRMQLLIDTALDAVVGMDKHGRITGWNAQAEKIFGWTRKEAVGRTLSETIIPLQFREAHERGLKQFLISGNGPVLNRRIEVTALRRNGMEFPVELTVSPARHGSDVSFNAFVRDISDRKESEATLISAKEEAERASRAKSEFLSSMSHELRTPMNAILGFAQLLESDRIEALSESHRENVQQILKAGYHLLELINEVLDLARAESGKVTLSVENVLLGPVMEEAIILAKPMAEPRRIQICDQTTSHTAQVVRADHLRLKQVLLNLLSNAIKYNREGGSVWIASNIVEEGRMEITVTDTGAGIPADQLDRLFEPFNRLGADKSGIEGTGIGLTLTKRLVELMNGTISVSSTPGRGTTFSVRMPVGDLTTAQEAEPADSSIAPNHTVLYVEDNPSNLALVKSILARRPEIRLLAAPHAQMGIDLAVAHRPDLIILDINLPGMDGYDILKHLQSVEATRHIPIIALSANATARDIEKGKVAGFERYLTKPLNVPRFLEAIDSLLCARISTNA